MHERRDSNRGLTVGQLLSQVCRLTGHHLRSHMVKLGLHRGQGFALMHLWHHDGIPQHELARAMHIRPASVTSMLQRMERDGWISRERDAEDQRLVRVFTTDKAKGLQKQAGRVFRQMEEELSAIYTEEEQATLRALLRKLHDHLVPNAEADFHHPPFFGESEEADA